MSRTLVAVILLIVSIASADKCMEHLGYLGSCQKDFVYCSTIYAVPVTLCSNCKPKFRAMTDAYNKLQEYNCTSHYIDKDRMNIVPTVQSILSGLWAKAYCEDCFINNNIFQFNNLSTAFENCLTDHQTNQCLACLVPYKKLNDYYTNLDIHNNGKVCFDMQDTMNNTRNKWSKDMKCCRREIDLVFFLCTSGLVTIIPIFFYAATYVLGKRRERNHGIISEAEHIPDVPGPSTSTNSTSNQTNIQSNHDCDHHKKSMGCVDEDSDTEDEAVLLKSNKNL